MSQPDDVQQEYLSPASASKFLDIPIRTLAQMRADGDGPTWTRTPGRRLVRYPVAGLREWMSGQVPVGGEAA